MDKHIELARKLLDYLECIIRGGRYSPDLTQVMALADEMFDLLTLGATDIQLSGLITENQRTEITSLAVKLNNKVKGLSSASSPLIASLRILIKGISGWMVLIFHNPSLKSLQIVIDLLISCVQELSNEEKQYVCCKGVSMAWNALVLMPNSTTQLTSVQLYDIKIDVFQGFLVEASLSISLKVNNAYEVSRTAIQKAKDLAHGLNMKYLIILTERTLDIASKIANNSAMLEQARSFYLLASTILQSISAQDSDNEYIHWIPICNQMSVRSSLALAYISLEKGQCLNAMSYVQSIENIKQENLDITITYAKFTIFSKDGDWNQAETCFRSLLKLPVTLDMALDATKTVLSKYSTIDRCSVDSCNQIFELFHILYNKFTENDDVLLIRIVEVQSFVYILDNENCGEEFLELIYKNLVDIVEFLSTVEFQNLKLNNDRLDALRNVIVGRIRFYRHKCDWVKVLNWCEFALAIYPNDHLDFQSIVIHKIDGLMNRERFKDAFELTSGLNLLDNRAPAILITFKVAIHVMSPLESVELIQNLLRKSSCGISSSPGDILVRLFQCCSVVKDSCCKDKMKCNNLIILLLDIWLKEFEELIMYKSSEYLEEALDFKYSDKKLSYFKISHLFLQRFMNFILAFGTGNFDIEKPELSNTTFIQQFAKLQNLNAVFEKVAIKCSLVIVKLKILSLASRIEKVVKEINEHNISISILGSEKELEGIASIYWHFGCLLTHTDKYVIDESISADTFIRDCLQNNIITNRYELAGDFFEASEKLFGLLVNGDKNTIAMNRVMCLILSTASRLDSCKSMENKNDLNNDKSDNQLLPERLKKARFCINTAQYLLRTLVGMENVSVLTQLKHLSLTLEFSILCRSYPRIDSRIIESFLSDNNHNLLDFTAEELIRCAEISSQEPSGTVVISLHLYSLALQVCARDSSSYALIGNLYAKIIDLSPTRDSRIDKIKEFVQLLSVAENQIDSNYNFDINDIDRICSLSYNTGVILASLEHFVQASEAVQLALQMLQHCSHKFIVDWQSQMQDACTEIVSKVALEKPHFLFVKEANTLKYAHLESPFRSNDHALSDDILR